MITKAEKTITIGGHAHLTKVDSGTRLRLVHSGFVTPKNDSAFKSMSGGWPTAIQRFGTIAGEQH